MKIKTRIRYGLFAIRWLWNNRDWQGTRQKYKELDRQFKKIFEGVRE